MNVFHDADPHVGRDQPGLDERLLAQPQPGGQRPGAHRSPSGDLGRDGGTGLAERLFHLGSFVALTAQRVGEPGVRLSIEAAVFDLAEVIGVGAAPRQQPSRPGPDPATEACLASLSRREREVVVLVAEGVTDAEIARRLYLSVNTVHSHLDRIRFKTGRRGRVAIAALAAGIPAGHGQAGGDG